MEGDAEDSTTESTVVAINMADFCKVKVAMYLETALKPSAFMLTR